MIRRLLGAMALAVALLTPGLALATSKVSVEWVRMTPPDNYKGAADNAPAASFGAITLTVSATPVSATAPAALSSGFARIVGVSGAVRCTLDGTTPSEATGFRVQAGDKLPVATSAGGVIACIEAADQPSATVSMANTPGTTGVGYAASGVTPISTPLTAAGASATMAAPLAHRTIHFLIKPGTGVATCYIEEQLDGTNWFYQTINGLPFGSASYNGTQVNETLIEDQSPVPVRWDCGATYGSFTSGTIPLEITQ